MLPRGVWHDIDKDRYRVRQYKDNKVTHLSYHKTLEAALETNRQLKAEPSQSKLVTLISQTKLYYKQGLKCA